MKKQDDQWLVGLSTQDLEATEAKWWQHYDVEGSSRQIVSQEKQQYQRVKWEGKRMGVAKDHT